MVDVDRRTCRFLCKKEDTALCTSAGLGKNLQRIFIFVLLSTNKIFGQLNQFEYRYCDNKLTDYRLGTSGLT